MNKTERVDPRSFFADFLIPLRYANVRKNINYLDRSRPKDTYWGAIESRTGGLEWRSATDVDSSKLIESLGHYWRRQNDPNLPKLVPYIIALREMITRQLQEQPNRDDREASPAEFVYPLF
jgi:hypothetical protein